MPEMPEIETVRRHLAKHVLHKRIAGTVINRPKTLDTSPEEFARTLANALFTKAQRRGKVIALFLSNGCSVVFHFMLEGYVRFFYAFEPPPDNAHILIKFETGEHLGFFKMNLGYIHLHRTDNFNDIPDMADLGVEPLSDAFTSDCFSNLLSGKRGMIKPFLMDQKLIAGIGNAYSNEILFCSQILPDRRIATVSKAEAARLYRCIKSVLSDALDNGGIYEIPITSDDSLTGGFIDKLKVAYRTGESCYVCGHAIETKRIGGRNAFYCSVCQK